MRLLLALFVLILNGIIFFGEPINNYKIELFGKIKIGKAPEEMEYNKDFIEMAGSGDLIFKYDNGLFYIQDENMSKVKVFDTNFKFVKVIGNLPRSPVVYIDSKNNLILNPIKSTIRKYNYKGEEIGRFSIDANDRMSNIFSFLLNDNFYYLKDDKENIVIINLNAKRIVENEIRSVFVKDDKKHLKLINANGKPEEDSKAKAFVDECNKKELESLYSKLGLNNEIKENLNSFIIENNTMLYDGKILTPLLSEIRGFYNILKQNKNKRIEDRREISIEELADCEILGFDKHNNSYWLTAKKYGDPNYFILTYSQYGELLDCFYTINKAPSCRITTSDEGDIYLYDPVPQDDYMQFYRIKNVWDPIDTSVKADTTTKIADTVTKPQPVTFAAKATSLTATSFIDYQSMYTPYRLFDGDPKTAWLEAAKGSGIDEAVSLALDKEITVDEIRFMPGYFDKQWWQANNRIKKMVVAASGQAITFTFEDKMEEQAKKFDAPLTFAKIKFIINAVYRSTGDDDTALSEISFYNAGKKLELDISGVK